MSLKQKVLKKLGGQHDIHNREVKALIEVLEVLDIPQRVRVGEELREILNPMEKSGYIKTNAISGEQTRGVR